MLAVKLIKNKQYPLDIPENVSVKHGDMVIVLTEKGEEVAQAYLVPPQVESILIRKKIIIISDAFFSFFPKNISFFNLNILCYIGI